MVERMVYINGGYCFESEAKVSIFDRGLLFADAIYEVAGVIDGKLMDFSAHMQRLDRSLAEMHMEIPYDHDGILEIMRSLVEKNQVEEGLVYMQFTRGSDGDREFLPSAKLSPTVFGFTQHKTEQEKKANITGIPIFSSPDIRWARRDIKSVGLMGSVLAKWQSKLQGGEEVLMHQDGFVTEGGATSFYIVKNHTIITRPISNDILHGCTRKALLELVQNSHVGLEERLFTLNESMQADEAFITGASTYVCPVTAIDGVQLGDGQVGAVTKEMQHLYLEMARKEAI
ncbi:MAG: D-amino-acid transaminase [Acidiferrobacterales bacterium]|nr:D-amino-acid transaminase [Acidiferrobacterales bacterium]